MEHKVHQVQRKQIDSHKLCSQEALLWQRDRAMLLSVYTRVPDLSCGIICVILRLAVLIQYRSVTDRHTHRHTVMAYTTLSIASHSKNVCHWHEHKLVSLLAIGQLRHQSATVPSSATHAADAFTGDRCYEL